MNLDNAFSSNADVIHGETSSKHEALEIIAQPCPKSKLRYRSDYNSNEKRRGVLQSQNNPNYRSPAIRIPKTYLDVTEHYVIRVCLVTVEHEKTKLRYIHPYDLEDIENDTYNDRPNKAVWYPIQGNDIDGIKSFPNLRIVKKKADDLKKHGDFRVFDSQTAGDFTPQLTCIRDTIKEFNLDKAQLAFTVGKKVIDTTNTTIVYALTTIFSNEIIDTTSKELDFDNTPTESKTLRSHPPKLSECLMYKYAPRQGHRNSKDEVLIFYTNGLQLKTYGELEVIFECEISDGKWWSEPVLDLEVKNQMVSFRTPIFPYVINDITPVNIILRQKKRTLEQLIFNYIPSSQCPNCSQRTMEQMNLCEETSLNKRRRCDMNINDETTDDMTLIFDNNPVIQQSNLESGLSPFSMTENLGALSIVKKNNVQLVLDKIADSIELLFTTNNFTPLLRICRLFVQKQPHLFHTAIENNYFYLLSQFIPIVSLKLLQQKNELGETILLHTLRLNRLDILKILLEHKKFYEPLYDVNNKKQNIFHILAMNKDAEEICDLLIEDLVKKSINIEEKFGNVDEDNHTPLELSIINDNLPITRYLLKHFNNDTSMINNGI